MVPINLTSHNWNVMYPARLPNKRGLRPNATSRSSSRITSPRANNSNMQHPPRRHRLNPPPIKRTRNRAPHRQIQRRLPHLRKRQPVRLVLQNHVQSKMASTLVETPGEFEIRTTAATKDVPARVRSAAHGHDGVFAVHVAGFEAFWTSGEAMGVAG